MNTKKKEVLYKEDKNNYIVVGHSAYVLPINHPDIYTGNLAKTSVVISYDPKTGSFETKNSHYILLKSL